MNSCPSINNLYAIFGIQYTYISIPKNHTSVRYECTGTRMAINFAITTINNTTLVLLATYVRIIRIYLLITITPD